MCLWQVSLAGLSRSLIGHLPVTFSGVPNSDVLDSFGQCLSGTVRLHQVFKHRMYHHNLNVDSLSETSVGKPISSDELCLFETT